MPPTTARGYIKGQHATYHVPTLDDVATAIKQLSVELRTAHAGRRRRILHDVDELLDHRRTLQREAR
jgi:phosphoribulokinase